MAATTGLLVKVRGDGAGFAASSSSLRLGAVEVEPILTVPPGTSGGDLGVGADRGATWLRLGAKHSENPWDDAHDLVGRGEAFAAAGSPEILAVEPDIVQQWDYKDSNGDSGMAASASPVCAFD